MQTDRQILAEHYETRKALTYFEEHGWPQWVGGLGVHMRLRFDRGWLIEGLDHRERWVCMCRIGAHQALCILRDHARVTLEKQDMWVFFGALDRQYMVYDCAAMRWLRSDGSWTKFEGLAMVFPTYDAAPMAGLAAAQTEGER